MKGKSLFDVIIGFLGLIAIIVTIADSYRTGGVVSYALQNGEPIITAVLILQTPWILSCVFVAASLITLDRRKGLTKTRGLGAVIGSLIASFLITWSIRAFYFAATGQTYPGQQIIELRVQTLVAGVLLFIIGAAFYAASIKTQKKA
ncbi:MAG: hypothetical protein ABSF82_02085 [Candidatus Bathyarchaeia archaeon]